MAIGDFTVFDEALANMVSGDWASSDVFFCALLDNTNLPIASAITPTLGDFTEVGSAGSYIANGTSLGSLDSLVSETSGLMTFDSSINPSWSQNILNDTDAHWALVYNFTKVSKDAIGFLDLGGPVNMSTDSLVITWGSFGLFTLARA